MRPIPLVLCASFWIALAVSSRGGCQATGIPSTQQDSSRSSSSSRSHVIGGGSPGSVAQARPLPSFAVEEAAEDAPWLPFRRPRAARPGARGLLQEEGAPPEQVSGGGKPHERDPARISSRLSRGRQGRRRAWLEYLVTQRQEEVGHILEDLKTKGALGRSNLTAPMSRASMQWVPLDPDFDDNFIAQDNTWPIACPSVGECPEFRRCGRQQVRLPPNMLTQEEREALHLQHKVVDYSQTREVDFGEVESCKVSTLSSSHSLQPAPPINCPRRPCPPGDMCEGMVFDPACSHP